MQTARNRTRRKRHQFAIPTHSGLVFFTFCSFNPGLAGTEGLSVGHIMKLVRASYDLPAVCPTRCGPFTSLQAGASWVMDSTPMDKLSNEVGGWFLKKVTFCNGPTPFWSIRINRSIVSWWYRLQLPKVHFLPRRSTHADRSFSALKADGAHMLHTTPTGSLGIKRERVCPLGTALNSPLSCSRRRKAHGREQLLRFGAYKEKPSNRMR